MKNIYIVLFSFCLLASACNNNAPTYTVEGIEDIVIGDIPAFEKWVVYDVKSTGNVKEHIKLHFEGLPDDVVVDTTGPYAMDGDLDFTAAVRLKKTGNDHQAHDYNIKLVCVGSVTGKRSFNLKLHVLERKLGSGSGSGSSAKDVQGAWNGYIRSVEFNNVPAFEDYLDVEAGTDSVYFPNFSGFSPEQGVWLMFNSDNTISLPTSSLPSVQIIKVLGIESPAWGVWAISYASGSYSDSTIALVWSCHRPFSKPVYTQYVSMSRK